MPGAVTPARARKLMAEGVDPETIRVRPYVSKKQSRVLLGLEDLSDWDDEELRRGQKRVQGGPRHGQFPSRPVMVVPKVLHDELVRRTLSRANQMFIENTEKAVQTLIDLMNGEDVDDTVRLRAATMIIERVMGKPKETVDIQIEEKPFQTTMDKIIASGSKIIDVPSNEA